MPVRLHYYICNTLPLTNKKRESLACMGRMVWLLKLKPVNTTVKLRKKTLYVFTVPRTPAQNGIIIKIKTHKNKRKTTPNKI